MPNVASFYIQDEYPRQTYKKSSPHTGPSESATSPSRIVLVILAPTLLVTRRPPDNEGPREGKSCKNSS